MYFYYRISEGACFGLCSACKAEVWFESGVKMNLKMNYLSLHHTAFERLLVNNGQGQTSLLQPGCKNHSGSGSDWAGKC